MKKKQRVKERHVSQLRKLIGAVAEQNGEEGTRPMRCFPERAIITLLSVAAVGYGGWKRGCGRSGLVSSTSIDGFNEGCRDCRTSWQGPLRPSNPLWPHVCRPSRCSLLLPQIRSLGMEEARGSWE